MTSLTEQASAQKDLLRRFVEILLLNSASGRTALPHFRTSLLSKHPCPVPAPPSRDSGPAVDSTLGQRQGRWPDVESTPGKCCEFAG